MTARSIRLEETEITTILSALASRSTDADIDVIETLQRQQPTPPSDDDLPPALFDVDPDEGLLFINGPLPLGRRHDALAIDGDTLAIWGQGCLPRMSVEGSTDLWAKVTA